MVGVAGAALVVRQHMRSSFAGGWLPPKVRRRLKAGCWVSSLPTHPWPAVARLPTHPTNPHNRPARPTYPPGRAECRVLVARCIGPRHALGQRPIQCLGPAASGEWRAAALQAGWLAFVRCVYCLRPAAACQSIRLPAPLRSSACSQRDMHISTASSAAALGAMLSWHRCCAC